MRAIEITTGGNGYPQGLHRGYIGFADYAEAEAFAERHNGKVVHLRRRDGWTLWESRGWEPEPFELTADTFGDDYTTFSRMEDWDYECREKLRGMIEDEATLAELRDMTSLMEDVSFLIEDLEDNEQVLLLDGHYCETIPIRTMSYFEDGWMHEIGVEIEGYDDEADDECE